MARNDPFPDPNLLAFFQLLLIFQISAKITLQEVGFLWPSHLKKVPWLLSLIAYRSFSP